MFLRIKCEHNEEEALHVSPSFLYEARKWKEESLAPETRVRQFWHHHSLIVAKCGDVILVHVNFEMKIKADKLKQKANNKKRISKLLVMLEWNMYMFCRSPEKHAAHRALVNEYKSITNGASFILQPSFSSSLSPASSSPVSNSLTLTYAIHVIL